MLVTLLRRDHLAASTLCLCLFSVAVPALATIDTFTLDHVSGPCGNTPFLSTHFSWENRKRIRIASGEKINVTLYGHGADFAEDATGANIHEWILNRGTTTNYPNAPIMFGNKVSKGYVTVSVRADPAHGLGDRKVTVKWLTGNEEVFFKIVSGCNAMASATYRTSVLGSGITTPGVGGTVVTTRTPNLLPDLISPVVLTRPLTTEIPTTKGGMFQVNTSFCSGLAVNKEATVAVPKLVWGVSGVNIEAANTQFNVHLIDPDANRTLDILSLAQGFPPNTPLVQRDNYPGRATSIRVILNPQFQVGPSLDTKIGCFTVPGSSQTLDPKALLIKVDPENLINEGNRENDNELRF